MTDTRNSPRMLHRRPPFFECQPPPMSETKIAAAVMSAVVPGFVRLRSSPSPSLIRCDCRAARCRPGAASLEHRACLTGYIVRHVPTGAPSNVGVRRSREQGQKGLQNRVVPVLSRLACAHERRQRNLKSSLKRRRVLACDAVAIGGKAHGFEERHRRFARDVLLAGEPSPPGDARRMAAYASRASSIVVSPSTRPSAVRRSPAWTVPWTVPWTARASGASRSTIPRFVFAFVHRRVAWMARRIVVPTGLAPAAPNAGPIAAALARKSSYVVSPKRTPGETLPGFGALASSRHASCAAAAMSALRSRTVMR